MNNDSNKWDTIKNVKKTSYYSEQENGIEEKKNLRDLRILKKEILVKFKEFKFLLLNNTRKYTWPMLNYKRNIYILISLRKEYLVLLSKEYGSQSIQVEKQIYSWISSLDIRIYAITIFYKLRYRFIYDVNKLFLSEKNLFVFLPWLKINSLLNYKICNNNFMSDEEEFRLRKIFNVNDYIIQILFVQILKPIVDVSYLVKSSKFDCKFSYSFNKDFFPNLKCKSTLNKLFNFSIDKILICIVEKIYSNTSCKWLIKSFPFPKKFEKIFCNWLMILNYFQTKKSFINILSKDAISFLILNFVLKKLKEFIHLKRKAIKINEYDYKLINKNWIIYFENRFIVYDFITFNKDIEVIVRNFCYIYDFKINYFKYSFNNWKKIQFLNFIVYLNNIKILKLKKDKHLLYIYPLKKCVIAFKIRVKNILQNNLNLSPYQLIHLLNPIIKEWNNNYFYIKSLKQLLKIDYFIWFRTWKFLKRKFNKVSTRILFKKFYKIVKIKKFRIWQFRGNEKDSIIHIFLFCKLNK